MRLIGNPNDETRMPKECRSTNNKGRDRVLAGSIRHWSFGLDSTFGFRHSGFPPGFRHSRFASAPFFPVDNRSVRADNYRAQSIQRSSFNREHSMSVKVGQVVENADIDRDTPQEEIHVEERRLTLHDFLKTIIKVNGSDLHLQANSVPMIRVDGRARFLDVPAPTDELMKEYVDAIINSQGEPADRRHQLEHKGSVDVAYSLPGAARFRTNIFHSREKYAIVMRRIVTKIPLFDELNLPPQVEELANNHRGIVVVSGTTGSGKSTSLAAIIGKINR